MDSDTPQFSPTPEPLPHDEAIAATEAYFAYGMRTERPGTVRILVRPNKSLSNRRADIFFLPHGFLSGTSDFFAKLLFVGLSVAIDDSPLPEILVDETGCDAFEIFALWVGRCDSKDTTFRGAIRDKIEVCFTGSGDEDKSARLLVESWKLAKMLESIHFKDFVMSCAMCLWHGWYDLLAMTEALVKLGCVRHTILRIILKELARQYVIQGLHLSQLFDDWKSRKGLVNARPSILAQLLAYIDAAKWGEGG